MFCNQTRDHLSTHVLRVPPPQAVNRSLPECPMEPKIAIRLLTSATYVHRHPWEAFIISFLSTHVIVRRDSHVRYLRSVSFLSSLVHHFLYRWNLDGYIQTRPKPCKGLHSY